MPATQITLFDLPPQPARLVYGGLPPSRPVATSQAAADRQRTKAPSIRTQVLEWVRTAGEGGMTAEESGQALAESRGLPPDNPACRLSAAARLTELKLGGFIHDSNRRRQTRGRCSAIVWTATSKVGDGSICEQHERIQ